MGEGFPVKHSGSRRSHDRDFVKDVVIPGYVLIKNESWRIEDDQIPSVRMVARLKLKGAWFLRFNFTQHGEAHLLVRLMSAAML